MRLDLHIHSTASDGACSPTEVVTRAARGGLHVIALADHDALDGWSEAAQEGSRQGVDVVPAVELSTRHGIHDLHVLGYFVDPRDTDLIEHQERARARRAQRIQAMVARLGERGVEVSADRVIEIAGGEGSIVGRPHLAQALIEAGIVRSFEEAFRKWIGDGHDAYVPSASITPGEAIGLIRNAGGVAVWAHPPRAYVAELLPGFVEDGLDGLEVFRRNHSVDYAEDLTKACQEYGLVRSGGSDWHGEHHGQLGAFFVEAEEVAPLLDLGGL